MSENTIKYFSDVDSFLYHEGTNYETYKKMGAHICIKDGIAGTMFSLWAPAAKAFRHFS